MHDSAQKQPEITEAEVAAAVAAEAAAVVVVEPVHVMTHYSHSQTSQPPPVTKTTAWATVAAVVVAATTADDEDLFSCFVSRSPVTAHGFAQARAYHLVHVLVVQARFCHHDHWDVLQCAKREYL